MTANDPTALVAERVLMIAETSFLDQAATDDLKRAAALIAQQAASIEAVTKERDEARAYLKAFCRACIDSDFERDPVGVHEANPSLGWTFQLDDMDVCPQRHVTGGQVRRAMEIVGFDKLKIEPATRTISDELSENRGAARAAEARANAAEAERDRLRAVLERIARWERYGGEDSKPLVYPVDIARAALSTAKESGRWLSYAWPAGSASSSSISSRMPTSTRRVSMSSAASMRRTAKAAEATSSAAVRRRKTMSVCVIGTFLPH